MSKRLQILVPHYKLPQEEMSNLLDMIYVQRGINFDDIGVIIANDGDLSVIDEEFLDYYRQKFDVEYHILPHAGVSTTRNRLIDLATADFIMFCDDDDTFLSNRELIILLDCTETLKWHTIEGPFWFMDGGYQYLCYSGGCYQDDTYHVGYAVAKSNEPDLTKVNFTKVTNNGAFCPLIIKSSFEEGTGHHSIEKYKGDYYAFYHGRDIDAQPDGAFDDIRTARVCRLSVKDGVLTAEIKETYL